MAAAAGAVARSKKKRVCYEVLHNLSTADICMLFVIPQEIRQFNEREAERNYVFDFVFPTCLLLNKTSLVYQSAVLEPIISHQTSLV